MHRIMIGLLGLLLSWCLTPVAWSSGLVDVPVNSTKTVTTGARPTGLPTFFGGSSDQYVIFKFSGLTPGQRYEVTLSFESGTDIGYGHSWVDGNPFTKDYGSFTGIGSGTGTGPRRESQQKYLFSVDPKSSCDQLYLVFRSNKPMPLRVSLQRPSGVTKDSQDRWGYYYVTDFDADRTAPFLLKRCTTTAASKPVQPADSGQFVDVPLHSTRSVTTMPHPDRLPSFFGSSSDLFRVFRFSGLVPGQRYEVTLAFESGTDIGYAHSWVDGNPFSRDYASFTGIGTGTGTGPKRESQQKYLFSVDPKSSSSVMYLVFRSNKPMPLQISLQRPSGVTKNSQDRWGYYYVTDFDADRTAPFLLKR